MNVEMADKERELYITERESLTNIAKHAQLAAHHLACIVWKTDCDYPRGQNPRELRLLVKQMQALCEKASVFRAKLN